MKEKGSLVEQNGPQKSVNFLDTGLLTPMAAVEFDDGSKLVKVADSDQAFPEQADVIAPDLLQSILAGGDERGRGLSPSDQLLRERERILYDSEKWSKLFSSQSDSAHALSLGMAMTALLDVPNGRNRLDGTSTYIYAQEETEVFNARLAATPCEYWLTFFSPSQATQYSARLIRFAVTMQSEQEHRTHIEPLIQSADGSTVGMLPEGFILTSDPIRIRI